MAVAVAGGGVVVMTWPIRGDEAVDGIGAAVPGHAGAVTEVAREPGIRSGT
jgi:hypothetical protein